MMPLKIADAKKALDEYLRDTKVDVGTRTPHERLFNTLCAVAGIAAGILVGSLIFSSVSHTSKIAYPKLDASFSAGVGGSLVAFFVAVPLHALRTTRAVFQFFAQLSHRKASKELNCFPENSQTHSVPPSLVQRLLRLSSDDRFKRTLMEGMDLSQLGETRQTLGEHKFRALLAHSNQPGIQLWKVIEKVLALQNNGEINQAFNRLKRHEKERWYVPLFLELGKQLERKAVEPAVKAALLNAAPFLRKTRIEFELPGCAPLVIDQTVANQIDGPVLMSGFKLCDPNIQHTLEQRPIFPDGVTISAEFLGSIKDYERFKRILQRLRGENVAVDLENWVEDFHYACQWFGQAAMYAVENDLRSVKFEETSENYRRLANVCARALFPSKIERSLLERLKELSEVEDPSREKSNSAEYSDFEDGDKETLLEEYAKQKTPTKLLALYPLCEEREFIEMFKEVEKEFLVEKDIRTLYDFLALRKNDPKAKGPYEACLNYAKALTINQKVQIWGSFFQMPEELRES